jgi:glycosyltransferase involved in cell wall biosynthesis
MSLKPPRISVVMPIYNGKAYLAEALHSLFAQSFSDFEILLIDDGSKDQPEEVVEKFSDPRLKFIKNDQNRGHAFSLNRGLCLATGEFVARMDQDDICQIDRFERQIYFLENNPEIGILGSAVEIFGNGRNIYLPYPADHEHIRANFLFESSVAHPTLMIRNSVIQNWKDAFYREDYKSAEDYDLWRRMLNKDIRFANLKEPLLKYRVVPAPKTISKYGDTQNQTGFRIQKEWLQELGFEVNEDEMKIHFEIGRRKTQRSLEDLQQAEAWLRKIKVQNEKLKIFSQKHLNDILAFQWANLCSRSSPLGFKAFQSFFFSDLRGFYGFKKDFLFKFFIRCLLKHEPRN